jgi:carboxymethylenebutenolidase
MLRRIQTGVDAMRAHPRVAGPVGLIGFCMGGTYTLLSAAAVDGIAAAVAFYGILSRKHGMYGDPATLDPAKKPRDALDAAPHVRCPVLAFFGKEDPLIPVSDVEALRAAWGDRADTEIVAYDGAGHAFMNDSRPAMYRPEAAQAAWARLLPFLRERLRT